MNGRISVEHAGAVATVTLDHPHKLNALTVSMWRDLARVMHELSASDALRCVVLRGAGNAAFAAGADIAEFATVRNDRAQGRTYHGDYVSGALKAVDDCRHPTVALIHGPCIGGGLEIASQCDLRIAGESARFGVPVGRLGFAMAYEELAAVLPIIGRAAALEMLLEGRVWDAREAQARGLVTRVVPDALLEAEVVATVDRITAGAPLAARMHKRMVRRLAAGAPPLQESERDENFDYFDTEDYRIGIAAFAQKKKPLFKGR